MAVGGRWLLSQSHLKKIRLNITGGWRWNQICGFSLENPSIILSITGEAKAEKTTQQLKHIIIVHTK